MFIERLLNWIFGDSVADGAEFAADHSDDEVQRCIDAAKDAGKYGDFERGMEQHLEHRQRHPK